MVASFCVFLWQIRNSMMKIRATLQRCVLCALLLFVGWGGVYAQGNYYRHKVQAGETLNRLSVKYGVTVDQILKSNPGLSSYGLKAGQEVLIPSATQESATTSATSNTGEGLAGSDCRTMHKVKRKETLWSISQEYGITVEELMRANPDVEREGGKIKKGNFLCIPFPAKEVQSVAPKTEGYKTLKLAVVLPLVTDAIEAERCVEFYRGFLMAVDYMKTQGVDIQVNTYSEPQSNESLTGIFAHLRQNAPQFVIGPLYPTHFGEMATYAAQNRETKWLIPFSSKFGRLESNPNVFLLNAPDQYKARFVSKLFLNTFKNVKVVFLHEAEGNEMMFSADLRNLLVAGGCEVSDLLSGYTAEHMQRQLSTTKRTVFVPEVSNAAGATSVMAKVMQLRKTLPSGYFSLLAYPEWVTTAGISTDDLYAADTYVFMNYFYNNYSEVTRSFVETYKIWFKTPLLDVYPRMALLGYDAGMYLMNGLKTYGKDFNAQELSANYYQSKLHFSPTVGTGGYVNDCMYFIHYRPNRAIEKVALN